MADNDVRIFNPPGHSPEGSTYSHISSIPLTSNSKLVFFAGQIGRDPVTRNVPKTLSEQVEIALNNVDICLAACGAQRTDIVQVRQYVVDMLPMDRSRVDLYLRWMDGHAPPSTLIGVQSLALEGLLYEIEVAAVVSSST